MAPPGPEVADKTLDDEEEGSKSRTVGPDSSAPTTDRKNEPTSGRTLPEAGSESIPPPVPSVKSFGLDLVTVPRAMYEHLDEIARGGIGRIYRAKDLRLNRVVAVKELLRPTPSNQRRFVREIEVTVGLQHPNIVSIHEAGRWPDGQLFYSMGYVQGQTLLAAIERCHTLEDRLQLLPAVISALEAVAFAHDKSVIHRDLKPANVLVGKFGETVVIDWGLAKYEGASDPESNEERPSLYGQTRQGAIVGTPPYMPPEQARGDVLDKTADVYALGAILYHLLHGRPPYSELRSEELITAIQQRGPVSLAALGLDVAPDLLAIVDKAMARSPGRRYRSGAEMAEELNRFAAGRMVGAYSYSATDLLVRFIRRNLAAFVTAVVALLVLVISATYGVTQIREQRDEAERHAIVAEQQRDRAEARTQALIVAQARALTDSDPTASVARLKQLREVTSGAITVAARAEELGVAQRIVTGVAQQLACARFAPDSKQMAVAGEHQSLLLWNAGIERPRRLLGHTERISDCVFSPDGKWLASAGYDNLVILWQLGDGTQRLLPPPPGTMRTLAFSRDGAHLAAAGSLGMIRHWWLETSDFQDLPANNTRKPVLEYTSDGKRLLSGPHEGRMHLWTPSLTQPASYIASPALSSPVSVATFAGDEQVLLGTERGDVAVWDLPTQQVRLLALLDGGVAQLRTHLAADQGFAALGTTNGGVYQLDLANRSVKRLTRHSERISDLQVAKDGRLIASAGWDKLVQLSDLQSDSVRTLRGHRDVVSVLDFSSDGRQLLSGSWDNTVRVWDIGDRLHTARRVLRGHTVGVHAVRFSPDGKWLASGGHDDRVRLWNTETGAHRVLEGHKDHVFRVLFSNDGRWIASSSDDMTVRLWSTRTSFSRVLWGHRADVEELAFSPDDQYLLSGSEDHTARLWTVATGQSLVFRSDRAVTDVAFGPLGNRFAVASRAGRVRIFDTEKVLAGAEDPEITIEHLDEVWGIDFGPQGGWFASADLSGVVQLRHFDTGRSAQLGPVAGATRVAFSPDERWLAIAGKGGQLRVCENPWVDCRSMQAERSAIHALTFSPNSQMLFSAGGDGFVYAWDLHTLERRVYVGHRASVFDLDVAPDGTQLVSASADETLRIWPVVPVPTPEGFRRYLDELTSESALELDF